MISIKKAAALMLAAAMITGLAACGKPAAKSEPNGLYDMTKNGEAIVSGIDTSAAGKAKQKDESDNARVFYEIFVGSFSDSDGDGTGDLKGIIKRLDYLNDGDAFSGKSLGVEGIWLTPIFTSSSYHKYNVDNYYEIDPKFGTQKDLEDLIKACHKRGIKIILDLVINHTGRDNEWFKNFNVA
ncbi:MAG: alpha-amylase, partial [Firmicutes bacterium]|nr:alpha-amylase [Bacillota bacterium]